MQLSRKKKNRKAPQRAVRPRHVPPNPTAYPPEEVLILDPWLDVWTVSLTVYVPRPQKAEEFTCEVVDPDFTKLLEVAAGLGDGAACAMVSEPTRLTISDVKKVRALRRRLAEKTGKTFAMPKRGKVGYG